MKITVNWMDHCGNSPEFVIHDAGPMIGPIPETELLWERRNTIHRCDGELFVRYFSTNGKPTNGFGGARFAGTFVDGSPFEYQGAWSSRAGVVNRFWPGRYIVDVAYGFYATAVKADAFISAWRAEKPTFGLVWVNSAGDIMLMPTRNGQLKDSRMHKIIEEVSHV